MTNYEIIGTNTENPSVAMVSSSGKLLTAASSHPNFKKIVDGLREGLDVEYLFNPKDTVLRGMNKVSERVTIREGKVFFDGDEIRKPITKKIMDFLEAGLDGWQPLVAFMEKVAQNPQRESRNMLYDFLENNEFSITDEGDIVGYKGMATDGDDYFLSIHSGSAIVNGVPVVNSRIRQTYGDVVEMPRTEVEFDPKKGCSTGLHVSNKGYAKSFGDVTLPVLVHPRDVVSVPLESGWQKVRVCRYVILPKDSNPSEKTPLYVPKHAAPTVTPTAVAFDNDSWDESDDSWDDLDSWDSWS